MKNIGIIITVLLSVPALPSAAQDSCIVHNASLQEADIILSADTIPKASTTLTADTIPKANAITVTDTKPTTQYKPSRYNSPYRFKPLQLIIPTTLFTVGLIGNESDWFQARNEEIRNELQENIDSKITVDDFTQYAPAAAVYGLNLCGIKGKHGYGDFTIILGTATALMSGIVNILKSTTSVMRPDGSTRNSFPSGHTATAFMGAELLRREYMDVSPWIGVAGYALATATGFFRMYNNRHWFSDVLAGAGIGIMSAEAAYWLYPVISKTFFRKRYRKNVFISPCLSEEGKGLSCSITF